MANNENKQNGPRKKKIERNNKEQTSKTPLVTPLIPPKNGRLAGNTVTGIRIILRGEDAGKDGEKEREKEEGKEKKEKGRSAENHSRRSEETRNKCRRSAITTGGGRRAARN